MSSGGEDRAGLWIGPVRLDAPVILAPMSGVTDKPFRRLARRFGAPLVVSEMIASQAMIRAARQSMKMSLGWDDASRNAPSLARIAEQAGIRTVTIHGRTRCQFYGGDADWAAIRAVKQAVSIPVIANGDITSPDEAERCLALSGADG